MHRPHPINAKIKGVSRLVILPDYQGVGLGSKFLDSVANLYVDQGWDFVIRTSAKNLIMKLYHSKNWAMYNCDFAKRSKTGNIDRFRTTLRTNCKSAGFKYKRG